MRASPAHAGLLPWGGRIRALVRAPGRAAIGVLAWTLACALIPSGLPAQVTLEDLVFTGGASLEGYRGNLAAVTVPAVDSTDQASAAVGELGLRGQIIFLNRTERSLQLQVDAGLRQFVAGGFEIRDYAPREWVGRAELSFRESLEGVGDLWFQGGLGGRRVEDRPPMPLFIQPGYGTAEGRVRLNLLPRRGVLLDAQVMGEMADYSTGAFTPQLALLDRRMWGMEVGARWDRDWTLRVHTAFRATEYPNQGTFDPGDPFRKDRAFSLGATWTLQSNLFVQAGLEATLNRSNSDRPEYNALSFRGVVSAPLPRNVNLNLYAVLTAKSYVNDTEFARLVPGEEADNASTVYLELARPLKVNLDGAVRFGWSRAETDIGESYFHRFGTTVLFRYRPWAP